MIDFDKVFRSISGAAQGPTPVLFASALTASVMIAIIFISGSTRFAINGSEILIIFICGWLIGFTTRLVKDLVSYLF